MSGHDGSDVRLAGLDAGDTLEFTTSNWATPQTVTVTAINDVDDTDDVVTLTFAQRWAANTRAQPLSMW